MKIIELFEAAPNFEIKQKEVRQNLQNIITTTLYERGKIMGSVNITKYSGELFDLVVPKINRNKGMATKLMNFVCSTKSIQQPLELEVDEFSEIPQEILAKFYKKFGFKTIGSKSPVWIMRRKI